MDLKDFVKEALVQIASGVHEAQLAVRKTGGIVNPATTYTASSSESHFGQVVDGQHIFFVDFDVAVTVTEQAGTSAEAKLTVASFLSLGAGGKSGTSNASTSRLTFKVPLALPVDADSQTDLKNRKAERDQKVRAYNQNLGGPDGWMGT